MEPQNIPLLDAEWRLIEPLLAAQMRAQNQINAYVSIMTARAGIDGVAYVFDPAKRALIPTYTKEQVDELLKKKLDQSKLDQIIDHSHPHPHTHD
jgi:hypothetical protein